MLSESERISSGSNSRRGWTGLLSIWRTLSLAGACAGAGWLSVEQASCRAGRRRNGSGVGLLDRWPVVGLGR